ncbi:hypothetical protein GGX14DRAFT_669607 [Mycena pura]|uniref:BTB domain-containing protein n=1 Tax=Mycena pura TaxID=153505 RepID=A0AAD6VT96_9AGAR|nr:hypothetical protein GGX14DRAFT_669607 [Mycena pura]
MEAPRRIEGLWFEDGNIVLQAGNALYRVYRGTLATHSAVFKDMLSFPQPPDSEVIDGCPLANLPDPEVEVTPFLKALFDPHSNGYRSDLRLSSPQSQISGGLPAPACPCALELEIPHDNGKPWTRVALRIPNHDKGYIVCAIQLAREVGALWVLPAAFYALSTVFDSDTLGRNVFHDVRYEGLVATLSVEDQESIVNLKGHRKQTASTLNVMKFLSCPPDIDGCESPGHCPLQRFRAAERGREMIRDYNRRPFGVWKSKNWDLLRKLCPVCLKRLKQLHKESRQAVWDSLPEMYGLPSWGELEQIKTAAIGSELFVSLCSRNVMIPLVSTMWLYVAQVLVLFAVSSIITVIVQSWCSSPDEFLEGATISVTDVTGLPHTRSIL